MYTIISILLPVNVTRDMRLFKNLSFRTRQRRRAKATAYFAKFSEVVGYIQCESTLALHLVPADRIAALATVF